MRIIVVDDSEPFLIAVGALLRDAGYEDVTLLGSGRALLGLLEQEARQAQSRRLPDLVLMDVAMPELDGIDTLRALKTSPRHEDIPVLIVSGQGEESLVEKAFDAGAVDFLGKPIKKLELRARIRSALTLKREMDRRRAREEDLVVLNANLKEANEELRRLSCTDSLTRVANRRYFEETFHREWNRAKRSLAPLSVVMIDVDHFKQYNDSFGHVAGDRCLAQIGSTLSSVILRASDLVARYGGEEFVALLANTGGAGAASLAESMRVQIERLSIPHAAKARSPIVTISLGVAGVVPGNEVKAWSLIKAADEALYEAKRAGRNRVCIHRKSLAPVSAVGL